MSEKQALVTHTGRTPSPGDLPALIGSGRLDALLDETACRRLLLGLHYPGGPACPRCAAVVENDSALARFWAGARFTCRACGQKVSPTQGTVLAGHLSAAQIIAVSALLHWRLHPGTIAIAAGVKAETVRAWRDKFAALAEVARA